MAKAKKEAVEKHIPIPVENTDERKAAFDIALENARKKHGDGCIQKITDEVISEQQRSEEVISSGIPQVNRATTRGGFLKGCIVEIYGLESSGKTTLCLHTANEVLMKGGNVLYIDMEHALQKDHVNNCGITHLNISQPDNGEQALDIAEDFAKAGTDLIIVDSVAALTPKAEIDGTHGESHMGLQARLMSQGLRKLVGIAAKNKCTIIFINQIRHKIGVLFGSPEVNCGGNALKFYASIRLDMRRRDQIKIGNEVVANLVKVKVVKNKTGAPYKEEEFFMYFKADKTIAANAIDFGSKIGVVNKAGSWYSYTDPDTGEDIRLGQGLPNAVEELITKPELLRKIVEQCDKNLFTPVVSLDDVI